MPPGTVAELRAATGMPFGKLVRFITLAYLERLRQERRTREGENFKDVAAEIGELVEQDCKQRGL